MTDAPHTPAAPPRPPRKVGPRDLDVLLVNEDFAVIGKPSGIAAHRSNLVREGPYLIQVARRRLGRRIWLPHRLDRATSGCMVLAFSPEWAARLQAALASPEAQKTYVALVRGYARFDGVIDVRTTIQDKWRGDKEAHSEVEWLGRSRSPRCSLLRVRPHTGRNHQVRRHVRDLNHPILGDRKHGDHRENRVWRDDWGLPRLGLHCLAMELPLPGARLEVRAPVPRDLVEVLERLPWWEDACASDPRLCAPGEAGIVVT